METKPNLLVIVGPTGVGKTEIAIQLGQRMDAEIVSADSRLLYRGMDIGTAKPTKAEQARVRHHLIDIAQPDENWSLSGYQSLAHKIINEIHARNHLPILVGGTGQYVRAITYGWQAPSVPPNPELRCILENWAQEITPEGLHNRLAALDPSAAKQMDFHNLRRTIRALEVIFSTGNLFSVQRVSHPSPYRLLTIGFSRPRPELYVRIDARIESMFSGGFVEEVRALLSQGYPPDLPSFSAVGYSEVNAYLTGQLTLDLAIASMKKRTRNFVRRQANWFKPDDPNITWFDISEVNLDTIENFIQQWLITGMEEP